MRSIATVDPRTPVALSMSGRYKSCRRSPSELFTKEQEQELQQCALSGVEDSTKAEQEDEVKEKESPVESSNLTPSKLTPLRWRSTSMKSLSGSNEVAGSAQPMEDSAKLPFDSSGQTAEEVRQPQLAKRPSQAQLRAQVMDFLSTEEVNTDAQQVKRVVNHDQAGEHGKLPVGREHPPRKAECPSSPKPAEIANTTARTELFPEKPPANDEGKIVSPVGPEEPVKAAAPEGRDLASRHASSGVSKKSENSVPVVPIDVDLPEEIMFQPVDLDEKYREKELVRHFTAAKIQNREEALLNNPGSPAPNGRKGLAREEPTAMTIEFLRARLQAERSASKTVKLKMESLSKKVVELESRLLAEAELRKSAEAALHDALTKLKQAVPQGSPTPPSSSLKVADTLPKDTTKTAARGDVESKADLVQPKTVVRAEIPSSTSILPMEKETGGSEDAREYRAATVDGNVVSTGGLWRDRLVSPHPSATIQGGAVNGGEESGAKASQGSSSGSSPERALSPSKQKQEKRAVIEERLRSMWAKIGEDMAALSEVEGAQEPISKDPVAWVGQLPSVLQEKLLSGDSGRAASDQQVNLSEGDNEQTERGYPSENPKRDPALTKSPAMAEKRNSFKRDASLAKNVAKFVAQYELQETAQREWEENFEAQQVLEQNEGEPPALVTPDGDVVSKSVSGPSAKIPRSQSEGERYPTVHGEDLSRSKSLGFLPSQQGVKGDRTISRKASLNANIEILDGSPIKETGGESEELLYDPETEVAEELPNGIYLHRSREEVDSSFKRSSKDAMYRRTVDRVGAASNGIHTPRRAAHPSRERFPRTDSHGGEMDQQGWPVREVQERASRDMYYDPVINNSRGGARADTSYSNSDREFQHRSKPIPDRVVDDIQKHGPWREASVMDRLAKPEDLRRAPANQYEEAPGIPYGYHRDHPEQDLPNRAASFYRQREDVHRGMPGGWQDGGDLPGSRNRGAGHPPYGCPPTYGVEEPQKSPYVQPGLYADTAGYGNRRDIQYMSHGMRNSRPDYYSHGGGMLGARPPMNSYVPPVSQPPGSQGGYAGWDSSGGHEDRAAPVGGMSEDIGEAGEVLQALRLAKQQIKSSAGDQAGFMTAQYTVSQEHRYGAGGQVSKTSYTVEAPVGWHLEGAGTPGTKKRNGLNGSNGVIDLTSANVTEIISGAGPLTVTGAESSYVEKLNVGRGIQFFFSS